LVTGFLAILRLLSRQTLNLHQRALRTNKHCLSHQAEEEQLIILSREILPLA